MLHLMQERKREIRPEGLGGKFRTVDQIGITSSTVRGTDKRQIRGCFPNVKENELCKKRKSQKHLLLRLPLIFIFIQ
jgi:hypothetical protein